MEIVHRIVDLISRNRISSVEVADALHKSGVIEGVKPLNRGHFVVGKVYYAFAYGGSNYDLHQQLARAPEGAVVLVEAFECGRKALFGDLVSKFLTLYRRVQGIVVRGYLRDAHLLIKENYPIWLEGVTPLGCVNSQVEIPAEIKSKVEERREYFRGGIMVCDDSGCTFIHRSCLNETLLHNLQFIEDQEDVWYYCLDTLKWDTFRIVCLKEYLQNPEVLPGILREKIKGGLRKFYNEDR